MKEEQPIQPEIVQAEAVESGPKVFWDFQDAFATMHADGAIGQGYDPEIVLAEAVETSPEAPWEWLEVREVRRRRRWLLPSLLFIATCLSTLYVASEYAILASGYFEGIYQGLLYAVPVMTILVCHEMGHFYLAHRYRVYASLPYFIPMPFSPFGTFGAVIAMEPRSGGRKAIFDIGIAGPLAGLVPTIVFIILGLQRSSFQFPMHGEMNFGSSPLFSYLAEWIRGPAPLNQDLNLHPMAFAGWVGLFITSLNLIPIGQLDGGHVLYALLRRNANLVARILLYTALFIVIFNFQSYGSWLPMLVLVFFFIGPNHPPTANDEEPLGIGRTILGWLTLAFILVGFTPIPIVFTR
jgi:Zn-dependent protease